MAEGESEVVVNGVNDGYDDIPEIDLSVTIEPYLYEPLRRNRECSSEEDSSADESESDDEPQEDHGHGDAWCTCGRCVAMGTQEECLCCRHLNHVNNKLQDEEFECITQHEGFIVNCLNRHVLETSYYEYVLDNGLPDDPPHELYRYLAYRRFVRWIWGLLRKRNRKILPACVVTRIRDAFPYQEFCGFKYPAGH